MGGGGGVWVGGGSLGGGGVVGGVWVGELPMGDSEAVVAQSQCPVENRHELT